MPYVIHHDYHPDFTLGNGLILEAKGHLDQDDRRKMLAVKEQHPEKDIRFIFQNPNGPILKGSKTTYAAWCTKKGFPYCSYRAIPKSWLNP